MNPTNGKWIAGARPAKASCDLVRRTFPSGVRSIVMVLSRGVRRKVFSQSSVVTLLPCRSDSFELIARDGTKSGLITCSDELELNEWIDAVSQETRQATMKQVSFLLLPTSSELWRKLYKGFGHPFHKLHVMYIALSRVCIGPSLVIYSECTLGGNWRSTSAVAVCMLDGFQSKHVSTSGCRNLLLFQLASHDLSACILEWSWDRLQPI